MVQKLKPLPDILKKNLKIFFVGTSPGVRSSEIGHYFAGRSNVFWRLLYESGLTEERLTTEYDTKMLDYSFGLTDIVKTPTRSVGDIKRHYTYNSTRRLNRAIATFTPKIVAFVGKAAFKIYGQTSAKLEYGYQYTHNNVRFYLLPSTSGQSYADTKYKEKLEWFRAINQYSKTV